MFVIPHVCVCVTAGEQRMIVRTAGPGPAGPAPQLIRTASGQMVVASVGQRIVQTGGQVLVARQPHQQPGAVLVQQQPVVR